MAQAPSDIILEKRKALGLTQEQAASAAGLSTPTWQIIERGVIENPTLETARKIAGALGCSLADIWTWAKVAPRRIA
jgi:transcriptional regulator with XRE-family HTH domain